MNSDALYGLIRMSRWAGERFDLVQAGGGNSSWKSPEDVLWVKSSGVHLCNATDASAFCCLDRRPLRSLMVELSDKQLHLDKNELDTYAFEQTQLALRSQGRPSIETLLHAQLHEYTLHTHPVVVTAIAVQTDCEDVFQSFYPEALYLPYATPGASLAILLNEAVAKKPDTQVAFLQNHGLLVSAATPDEAMAMTEEIALRLEQSLGLNLSPYHRTSQISQWISAHINQDVVAYYCNDETICRILNQSPETLCHLPVCPDQLVYCGPEPLVIDGDLTGASLKNYMARWQQYPRVVLWNGYCYLVAGNLKKCHDIQDILRFHLLVLTASGMKNVRSLPEKELRYLMDWNAEKYRQKL